MALHSQILLIISLSFLFFQFNIAIDTSYISLSPNGAPSPLSSMPNGEVSLDNKESVHKYVDKLMESSVAKTEEFLDKVIEKRLKDPTVTAFAKDCLLVCKEVYELGVDAMKKTMEDMDKGYYYSANVDLSGLSTDLDTCMDCVKEIYGDDQEFIKFDDWAGKVTHDALEKVAGFSS
ncbi:hypothetical protein BC332_26569 [Capsicum chinense]|nr:hypothetical protein BC332_26569 [Capsicum chinense]